MQLLKEKTPHIAIIYSISLHLVNTFLLLASLTLTARWSSSRLGQRSTSRGPQG